MDGKMPIFRLYFNNNTSFLSSELLDLKVVEESILIIKTVIRRYIMAKYGKKAQSKVKRAMHEMKRGELKSGRSGKTVKSRKQAIAIGLSEARKAGGKVPKAPKRSK